MTKIAVMLVDDDASLLDIVSMAMEDAGYSVVTAADGSRLGPLGWREAGREDEDRENTHDPHSGREMTMVSW